MDKIYNKYFFTDFYAKNGGGSYDNAEQWEPFFENIARNIVDIYGPKTVLDAGCAFGYLVKALRGLGVEAYGFDISEYAIAQADEKIKPYVFVHSITDPLPDNIPQQFDLVLTIEVLEHLSPDNGSQAIKNLCSYSDTVIFTSTPDDIEDKTHINVRQSEYWAKEFAKNSFYRDLFQTADYICPWAMVFRRNESVEDVIFNYEINSRIDKIEQDKNINEKDLYYGKIYFDCGEISEKNTAVFAYSNDQIITQKINIPAGCNAVRFDPIEKYSCVISDLVIGSSNGILSVQQGNFNHEIDGKYYFFTSDPQLYIPVPRGTIYVEIRCNITIVGSIFELKILSELISSINLHIEESSKLVNEANALVEKHNGEIIALKNNFEAERQQNQEEKAALAIQHEGELTALKNNFESEEQRYQNENNALIERHKSEVAELKYEYEKEKQLYQNEKTSLIEKHISEIVDLKNKFFREKKSFIKRHKKKITALENNLDEIKKGLITEKENEINELRFDINSLSKNCNDSQNTISTIQAELEHYKKHYNDAIILRDRYLAELEHYKKHYGDAIILRDRYFAELEHYKKNYSDAIILRDRYQAEAGQWQNSYDIISNSEFWKITKPARKLLDIIKGSFRKTGQSEIENQNIDISFVQSEEGKNNTPTVQTIEENIKVNTVYLGSISLEKASLVLSEITDIIIPVYNGFEYLEALFKSIKNTKAPYRLIIIDDKSTDKRVLPFLKNYEKRNSNVILLENKDNLGFVKTVNRGLKESKNNVALVNTDVVLPPMWLERLMLPIAAEKNVATSTPFTNCGTICSFPVFCQDNKLFFGMELNEIDKAFSDYIPQYPIIPTGVGFCMGMSRRAIDKVGILDEDTFGKGYGEENDWCRRAAEEGFFNVHVENLFVYHKHGGSFESEEKKSLINKHLELLSQKHPDYNRLVAEYCQLDPCASMRTEIKKRLIKNNSKLHTIVAFNHSWGGGASLYLVRERTKNLYEGKEFVQVEYRPDIKKFRIEFFYRDYHEAYDIESEDFTKVLDELPERVDEIWANELVSYPELYTVLEKIGTYAEAKKAYLLYLLHDYFSVCPTVNLLNPEQKYCCIPEIGECQKCLENNPRFNEIHQNERKSGISVWRRNWLEFFKKCSEIRVFSDSSKEILCKTYPDINLEHVIVKPHCIDYLPDISNKKKRTKALNIAAIGAIEGIKGVDIVKQMALLSKKYDLDINMNVIGRPWPEIPRELCYSTGAYERSSLPTNILEYDIDIILIPSIWPETFSYTAQEAMKMGLPVACFNLGAPAQRVKKYNKGIIIPQVDADSALNSIIKYAEKNIDIKSVINNKVLFIAERFDYASRYRAEHFREELKFHGTASDLFLLEEAVDKSICDYSAIIFYRCSSVIATSYICKRAKKLNIKLFFDIDDLVFDKEVIMSSNLPASEKSQYIGLSEGYCDIINKCDGIITSTEALAKHLRHSFSQKPVCVRRNSASLEMETLSVCAGDRESAQETDTVNIAYFSGSWTHDRDFKIIAKPLSNIFRKYSNVHLQIYGCLHIPQELKDYRSRIEVYDFDSNWRTLPEKVAKAHIHLAPLEDTVFNECKSENKWTEAALAGRPVVASRNSELELVIKNGVSGFLCSTEKEWEEALSKLIEDKELRDKIGKNAQEEALSTHLTRNNGDEAINFIEKNK